VKDFTRSAAAGTAGVEWKPALPGEGDLPLKEIVSLLRKNRYDGWLTFEYEKRWRPESDEPEKTLPAFVKWARSVS
jgi:sugar phosphate isomerase/epimerase